eukprot:247562-Chlamydomonas_euryale.AAC.1
MSLSVSAHQIFFRPSAGMCGSWGSMARVDVEMLHKRREGRAGVGRIASEAVQECGQERVWRSRGGGGHWQRGGIKG